MLGGIRRKTSPQLVDAIRSNFTEGRGERGKAKRLAALLTEITATERLPAAVPGRGGK
jgi:hypothetical protein